MKRDEILRQLQMFDFALQEAALYLNSHPDDQNALSYYHTVQNYSRQTRERYEKEFGPLTNRDNTSSKWEYIYGEWPWEGVK